MIKKIFKILLITILILSVIIFYLSIFGLKTDKFNTKINNNISKIDENINLNLKKVNYLLKPYNFTVNVESKNPEIIVVTEYYSGISAEEKIEFLKNHPGLKDIDAIKNNRIYKIGLIDLAPGIRNSKTVGKLYQMFYGNEK